MKSRGKDSKDSWLVSFALSCVYFLTPLPMRLGGMLYVSLIESYQISRAFASLPFSIAYLMRSLTGPCAGYLGSKIGLQTVTMIGCLLCAIGMAGCFFAENIITIVIFLGLFFGTGFGWSTSLNGEIINEHFEKHRATANGLVFAASGLGGCLAPFLLEKILKVFGVSGTFLLISGILLHTVPACILISKPRSETPKKLHQDETKISNVFELNSKENIAFSNPRYDTFVTNSTKQLKCTEDNAHCDKSLQSQPINSVLYPKNSELDTHSKDTSLCSKNLELSSNLKDNILCPKKLELATNSKEFSNVSGVSTNNNLSFIDLQSSCSKGYPIMTNFSKLNDSYIDINTKKQPLETQSGEKQALSQKNSMLTTLNILWNPIFLLMNITMASHFYSNYLAWTIIVDVVRDKGVAEYLENYFVIGISLSDMVGRLLLGYVIDRNYMSKTTFSALCFIICALTWLFIPWTSDFVISLILVCVLGFMMGGNTTNQPGVITEFVTEKEKRAVAIASRHLLYAPMSFTMSPLIGYFRGYLGSYDGLLYTMASICMTCAIIIFFLPKVDNYIKNCNRK